jgi:hypothetical protein
MSEASNMRQLSIRTMLLLVASFAIVLAIVAPLARRKPSDPQAQCMSNLKQLSLCLEGYRSLNNVFPCGTLASSSPKVEDRLSYYAQITPWLDYQDLHDTTDPAHAWNSPTNLEVANTRIETLHCPLSRSAVPPAPQHTNYIGIAGLGVDAPLLPKTDPRAGVFGYDRQTTLADIKDGTSSTMMLAETGRVIGSWLQGGPATVRGLDPANKPYFGSGRQFGSLHGDGACVAMADGSVRWVGDWIGPKVFEALSTIAGGERLPPDRQE